MLFITERVLRSDSNLRLLYEHHSATYLDIEWLQGQDTKVISQSGKSKDQSVQSVAPWQAQAEQILSAHMGILCQVLCERMATNAGSSHIQNEHKHKHS